MVTCADTSFLFALYGNDVHTLRAVAWMKRRKTALTLSTLNEYELENALRFAEFRKLLAIGDAVRFLADFEADKSGGRLWIHVCNLADIVDEAKRLSATYTLVRGHRSFDILHVAAALKMNAARFLTFDSNQKKLAQAEGMETPL